MSKVQIKDATWYALAGLFVAVALLPILKASSPQYFPEGFKGCGKNEKC
jgi:hypothetical protein